MRVSTKGYLRELHQIRKYIFCSSSYISRFLRLFNELQQIDFTQKALERRSRL